MTSPAFQVAGARRRPVEQPLVEYLLRLGDDRLVLGHRLSEWCGHGPILEEDIAITNIALDLIGHATSLLGLAAELEGKGRDADALAFFRDPVQYRNCLLVELPRGDFAYTMLRQFLFDAYSVLVWDQLSRSTHDGVAAIAAKCLKEDKYHLRHSSEWVVRLGDGTEESHSRAQRALNELWPFTGELFVQDDVDEAVRNEGVVLDADAAAAQWNSMVRDVIGRATLTVPDGVQMRTGGRTGRHTEYLGQMLSMMQSVARAHPGASW